MTCTPPPSPSNRAFITSVIGIALLSISCGPSYPDISTFKSSPSDQFFFAASDDSKIVRAHPYKGAASGCAHEGGHVHFTTTGAPYTVDVYSPVSGYVESIDTCYIVGANDRYGISINFAKSGSNTIAFTIGMEPMAGYLCSDGTSGKDNGTFKPYILVKAGQKITQGDLIGRMLRNTSGGDGTHIHFGLRSSAGKFACPNIFSASINARFEALYGTETCSGTSFPAGTGFCYQPSTTENFVSP